MTRAKNGLVFDNLTMTNYSKHKRGNNLWNTL